MKKFYAINTIYDDRDAIVSEETWQKLKEGGLLDLTGEDFNINEACMLQGEHTLLNNHTTITLPNWAEDIWGKIPEDQIIDVSVYDIPKVNINLEYGKVLHYYKLINNNKIQRRCLFINTSSSYIIKQIAEKNHWEVEKIEFIPFNAKKYAIENKIAYTEDQGKTWIFNHC